MDGAGLMERELYGALFALAAGGTAIACLAWDWWLNGRG